MSGNPQAGSANQQLCSRARILGNQLGRANTHLHYFAGLLARYGDLQRQKDFWDYTLAAHGGMAIRDIAVVYDTHRDGVNLGNLLALVDGTHLGASEQQRLQGFIAGVGRASADPDVRSLRQWRNNIVAHFNDKIAATDRESFSKQYQLDEAMLQRLIDKGFEIVEWCARLCGDGQEFPRFPEGKDGHAVVVNAVVASRKQSGGTAR
jgi:hypothetical protein